MAGDDPTPEDIRTALGRVLASREMTSSERQRGFLRFVVERAIEGRTADIKAYTLALEVFGRGADFDPQTDSIVRVEASRLRRKLQVYYSDEGREDPVRIELPTGSYVPVFRAAPPLPAAPAGSSHAAEPPGDAAAAVPATGGHRHRLRHWLEALGGLLVVGLIVAAAQRFVVPVTAPESAAGPALVLPASALLDGPRLAVTPLANLTGDPNLGHVARGIAAEISARLALYPQLAVIATRTSAYHAEGDGEPMVLGRLLDLDYLVRGSLRRLNGPMRITTELVDTHTGRILWAGSWDRELLPDAIVPLQDEIAERIVASIFGAHGEFRPLGWQGGAAATHDPEAFDCVLRTYGYLDDRRADLLARVRDCLEDAVRRDPDFALAWAMLALVYLDEWDLDEGQPDPDGRPDPIPRALAAARRAVELDPGMGLGQRALADAAFYSSDLATFRSAAAAAISLAPNHADLLADMGRKLAYSGDWAQGTTLVRKAVELNPNHPEWYDEPLVLDLYLRGRYTDALAVLARWPDQTRPFALFARAIIDGRLGRDQEARQAVARLLALNPRFPQVMAVRLKRPQFRPHDADEIETGLAKAGIRLPDA